ncbi:formylglycine-generating enzyme family protein [Candidatus Gracilibacteria bacterium]|nr:formylglycine-generating enzyme family protein [Candidatus Gracilibacteria bacterium]
MIERGAQPAARATALLLAADTIAELERFKKQEVLYTRIQVQACAMLEQAPATAVPAPARVACGAALAIVGDPRRRVGSTAAFVAFTEAPFIIGSTPEEAAQAGKAYEQYYLQQGDTDTANRATKWPEDEINTQPLTLAGFALARYPVTNAQYAHFIAAEGYNPDAPWWSADARVWLARNDDETPGLKSWQRRSTKVTPEFWEDRRVGKVRRNHPVVGITWYEAQAFCAWLTQHLDDDFIYRLPSEAEWEFAARGNMRRPYPWGTEEPNGERANFNAQYTGTSAVGCFPLGTTPEGLLEMAGNVWEWTRSVYQPYPYDPHDGRESTEVIAQKRFTIRGGSWYDRSIPLRAAYRDLFNPVYRIVSLGFRLARHHKV